jgi:2-polyprenyl-3-methyl-5-hydroxy-6-metoxy-1,4-benzoquinol methylase
MYYLYAILIAILSVFLIIQGIKKVRSERLFNFERSPEYDKILAEIYHIDDWSKVKNKEVYNIWFAYAYSTLARGRNTLKEMQSRVSFVGKSYLDVGCAYGGFLVAAKELKAKNIYGIDVNDSLLKFANYLNKKAKTNAIILNCDIQEDRNVFKDNYFDIMTCNDVMEHVTDAKALLRNMLFMLKNGGCIFMEIPSVDYLEYIMADCHFQIPGMTLLGKKTADKYYGEINNFTDFSNDVTYRDWSEYEKMFKEYGCHFEILNNYIVECKAVDTKALALVMKNVEKSIKSQNVSKEISLEMKGKLQEIKNEVSNYISKSDSMSDKQKKEFYFKYRIPVWKVMLTK